MLPDVRTYRELFAVAEFRALFLVFSASMAASTIAGLALATLVFDRTGSPLLSAVSMFAPNLAQVLGATVFMSAADRLPPRPALTGMSVVWGLTVALVAAPGMPVAVVLAIVVASGVLGSVSGAISWGLLSEILPPGGYVLGRSVMQMSTGGMQIAGYAASAILLQFIAPRVLLLIAAALYAGSAAASRLGLSRRPPRSTGRPSASLTWRTNRRLWATPDVAAIYLALWVPNGLVVGAEALFVPYARTAAGILFTADALGMLAGDAIMGRWMPARWRRRLVTPLRVLLAGPYLLFAFHPAVPAAVVLVALASAGFGAGLLLQERLIALTPESVRGHALGLHSSGMLTMQGVAALLAGTLAGLIPTGDAMAVMAVASLAITLALTPALRRSSELGPGPDY
jgi:MFS family permease